MGMYRGTVRVGRIRTTLIRTLSTLAKLRNDFGQIPLPKGEGDANRQMGGG
jgi:hypothetical protein